MTPSRMFQYKARDDDGKPVSGVIAARDRAEAARLLSERGEFVVSIAASRATTARRIRPHATKPEVAWNIWQLATLTESGMGLSESLDCLSRQGKSPRLKALLAQVSADVQEGASLSEAMRRHPRSFSGALVTMIRASELSGTLTHVLQRSAGYMEHDLKVVRKLRAALAYPLFMILLSLSVCVLLLAYVLPQFATVFASREAALPLPTRVLLAISDSLLSSWHIWLLAIGAPALGLIAWLKTNAGRRTLDAFVVRAPGFSRVFNAIYQCRSFRALSMLLNARVPLMDAIEVVREIIPNSRYRELWSDVEEQARLGERLSGPLFASDLIDESVAQIIHSGDQAGKLESSLSRTADFMEERYDRCITTTLQFIEPAMILVMGALVGFIALSMMLPLFKAASVMAGT